LKEEFHRASVNINKEIQKQALKIGKKQGFNTFTALVNRLVFEYIEKNREYLKEIKS
jgi:hypothetical protein